MRKDLYAREITQSSHCPCSSCSSQPSSVGERQGLVSPRPHLDQPQVQPPLHVDPEGTVNCTYCGKTFTAVRNARRHIREIHLESKSAACHLCPRAFGRRERLKIHIRSEHPEHFQQGLDFQ